MTKFGKFGQQVFERAKAAYVENNITLESISSLSEDLLGMKVSVNTLKEWARDYEWSKEKSLRSNTDTDNSISKEVDTIRQIIFREIYAKSVSGIMVTGANVEAAKIALETIDGIDITEVSPRGIDAQLVNSYMNLLTKAGINIDNLGQSAKTSRQQVMEAVREEMKSK